jgi:hypothetical protein
MAIETIGDYQVHLNAVPAMGSPQYAPYVTIARFDEEKQDFVTLVDRARAPGDEVFDTEEEAEEAARRYANQLIARGDLPRPRPAGGEDHAH